MFGHWQIGYRMEGSHSISCISLSVTESLLNSGLKELLKNNGPATYRKTISILCQMFHSPLLYDDIGVMVDRILKANGLCFDGWHRNLSSCVSGTFSQDKDNQLSLFNCGISSGAYGRKLVAAKALQRGHVLLQEKPIISTLSSPCHCHAGPILTEHVTMALKWTVDRQQLDMNMLVPEDDVYWKVVSSIQSGLSETSSFPLLGLNNETAYGEWPAHTQYVMATTCALCAHMYFRYVMSASAPVGGRNEDVFAHTMFHILCRLPANTHSIPRIVPDHRSTTTINTTSSTTTITQERFALGLFMSASSVNHACLPNSTVRFNFDATTSNPGVGISDTNDGLTSAGLDNIGLLNQCFIELVVMEKDLAAGDEVTMSYGPLSGTHNCQQRRKVLLDQYLFTCECNNCKIEWREIELFQKQQLISGVARAPAYSTHCADQADRTFEAEAVSVTFLKSLHDRRAAVDEIATRVSSTLCTAMSVDRYEDLLSSIKGTADSITHLQQSALGVSELLAFPCSSESQDADVLSSQNRMHMRASRMMPLDLSGSKSGANAVSRYHYARELVSLECICIDLYSRVLAEQGDFAAAAGHVTHAIARLVECGIHDDRDVSIARERVKLATLLFSSGKMPECMAVAKDALECLQVCVSSSDPDLLELVHMRQYFVHRGFWG